MHPKEIHLCVAIVNYKTNLKAPRKGLCTSWLTRLPLGMIFSPQRCPGTFPNFPSGARIRIGLDQGTMKLPADSSKPIIMVGPGTGVAPLRAFLEERARLGVKGTSFHLPKQRRP